MALKAINLGVTFLLELCMLAAFAYWGFTTGTMLLTQLLLGIGVPVLVVLVWGRFMAPKSSTRLTGAAYLVLKFILFGAAALALAVVGQTTLAILFMVASVINQVLMLVWKQDAQTTSQ